MTIFTFAATKGGEGKSTMSVQAITGLSLNEVDNNILAVDGDKKQISMLHSLTNRVNDGYPGIAATELSDGAMLRTQVRLQAPNFDHVVIDVGAKDSSALRAALTVTDVLMVPFTPRAYSLWAYQNMFELINEARELREIRVVPFLNMADPPTQPADNDAAIEAIEAFGFPVAPIRIGSRKSIDRASAAGLNLSEYRPADPKAREEIAQLVQLMVRLSKA